MFRYAVATARLTFDPTRDLRGALTAPTPKHYGAIIDAKRAGELLRAIDGYEGQVLTKLAMQLSPHVFVRPGELRHAEWEEIDLEAGLWIDPGREDEDAQAASCARCRGNRSTCSASFTRLPDRSGYVFPRSAPAPGR